MAKKEKILLTLDQFQQKYPDSTPQIQTSNGTRLIRIRSIPERTDSVLIADILKPDSPNIITSHQSFTIESKIFITPNSTD